MSELFAESTPDDAYDVPPYAIVKREATLTHIVTTVVMDGELQQFEAPHVAVIGIDTMMDFYKITKGLEP